MMMMSIGWYHDVGSISPNIMFALIITIIIIIIDYYYYHHTDDDDNYYYYGYDH